LITFAFCNGIPVKIKFLSVTEYMASLGELQQTRMEQIRKLVKETAPQAEELLSYGMPAFKLHKRILIYYAAHTNHIGFYPASLTIFKVFAGELQGLAYSRGTIRLQNNTEIPLDLIRKIIEFRAMENLEKEIIKEK